MEQDNPYAEQQRPPRRKRSPFDALIPRGNYFFTPILLDINILVYVLMVISGVSPTFPGAADLIRWGANVSSMTIEGEPWRLFTSMFLHFGILHLAFNMYALYSIGSILEPFVGKWRFLVLYLLAGLGGSALSLWWHAGMYIVSAGASGAIFGTFGIFAALLTTDIIDKSVRGSMLRSITFAIVLNLGIGLSGGIDNSAHTGGLITGAIGGWLSYFDLKAWYYERRKVFTGLLITVAITAAGVFTFWKLAKAIPPGKPPEELAKDFDNEMKRAMDFYSRMGSSATAKQIEDSGVVRMNNCFDISRAMEKSGTLVPGYVALTRSCSQQGILFFSNLEKAAGNQDSPYADSAKVWLQKMEATELKLKQYTSDDDD